MDVRVRSPPSALNFSSPRLSRNRLGSVLNHVMLHQTIIGLEAKKQFGKIGYYPDVVIGCASGSSNFAAISYPFLY